MLLPTGCPILTPILTMLLIVGPLATHAGARVLPHHLFSGVGLGVFVLPLIGLANRGGIGDIHLLLTWSSHNLRFE